jgi:hypothetical protein
MFLFLCICGFLVVSMGLSRVATRILVNRLGVTNEDLPDAARTSLLVDDLKNQAKFMFYFVLVWPDTYFRAYLNMKRRTASQD